MNALGRGRILCAIPLLILAIATPLTAFAAVSRFPPSQSGPAATIIASYQAAFGRDPEGAELQWWLANTDSSITLDILLPLHAQWLRGAPDEQAQVVRRAFQASLQHSPTADDLSQWRSAIQQSGLL